MNQKSNPTCSHDFKANGHETQSTECDKVVPTIIDVSGKQIVEDNADDVILQKYDKVIPTNNVVLNKQVKVPPAHDTISDHQSSLVECCNDQNSHPVILVTNNQMAEHQTDSNINGHQDKSQTYNKDGHLIIGKDEVEDLTPGTFRLASTLSNLEIENALQPPTLQELKSRPSILLRSTATQLRILSNLPSPTSINVVPNQPQSLFLQALSKLNESAISFAVNSLAKRPDSSLSRALMLANAKSPELTPPVSLGNAPPSYSFVLRQMAVRRRPRMFGTYLSSPSFIPHTPPPTYTASFDIYLDNLPPPPTRMYNYGFAPMLVVCPDCGFTGMTQVTSKVTLCTHLCAITLCIMCCWICVPLPYVMRSCKDVYHYCRNCRSFLGTYCPTNPEQVTVR